MEFPVSMYDPPPDDQPAATHEQPGSPPVNPLMALQQILGSGRNPVSEVPARVIVALNFVKMCNDHVGYWGMMGGNSRKTRMVVKTQELPGAQSGALDRACVCLGRYFDGHDIDEPLYDPTDYLTDEEMANELGRGDS